VIAAALRAARAGRNLPDAAAAPGAITGSGGPRRFPRLLRRNISFDLNGVTCVNRGISKPGRGSPMPDNAPKADMDIMKMLSDFRLPMMPDMEALAASQRKNMEALSQANRVALEGAQAIARRHMEILQHGMSELTQAMQAMSTQDPKTSATRQAEMMKGAYEKAVGNMKELADLIQKSSDEALAVLNRRFAEAMDEVRALSQAKK
jgi:phasin family protein